MSFDARTAGTSAETWAADPRMHDRPRLALDGVAELLVVAAHPDDETLGAAGLIAECVRRGIPARIVVVTDGGAIREERRGVVTGGGAAPEGQRGVATDTAARRTAELRRAAAILGAPVAQLNFPDGATREHRDQIAIALQPTIAAADDSAMILSPWRGDGHRDHRVVGEIVAGLVGRRTLLEYPIWMWHWGNPDHADVPWARMVSLPIDGETKQRALAEYPSQTEGHDPVLVEGFRQNFESDVEYFIGQQHALPGTYFDETYDRHDDPWGFESRWYEARKRAITVAALPDERYGRTLEIGCSIGVLTDALADRSDAVLAVDVSQAAVDRAADRLGARATVERADVLENFPEGPFDLIVLSEVGYYFNRQALQQVLDSVAGALAPGGTFVACHWRHPVADYLLGGDEVHEVIRTLGLPVIAQHLEDDFVLEVFSADPRSVAARTGLL